MSDDLHKVGDILQSLRELGAANLEIEIAQIVELFGHRSYGPFLLVPALIGISPIGAIPGVPAVLSAILALFALQIGLGRSHLWLPAIIAKRQVEGARLVAATRKLEGIGQWMDRWFHGRLTMLVHPPMPRLAAVLVLILCVIIPPLEIVPFAVAAPMAVIAAIGLALMVKDGALMLLAFLGTGAAFLLAFVAASA